ncbi:MAG TPA: S53 family peptidase [Candidatus Binatia bacterium]|nr:S53 family peptidase [Candidatus Binatia bacterium]
MTVRRILLVATLCSTFLLPCVPASAASRIGSFKARPPIHVRAKGMAKPSAGLRPADLRRAYRLPEEGGSGTIAIVDAFDAPTIERDLAFFDEAMGLPPCTMKNGCFEKRAMAKRLRADAGWSLETALDVEWAHAIAPGAKILLVEAKSAKGADLLAAVDLARKRRGVVAVSMSWGGKEFTGEEDLDGHFAADGVTFFASSGDDGAGASWPAVSPNVVAVGGTTLDVAHATARETAWAGSGGGVSAFIPQPAYQRDYGIRRAGGKRAVPDVAYAADPMPGFAVYRTPAKGKGGWYVLGGTSAGAPQWAAIKALGLSASNERFYADKASAGHGAFFRDIVSGSNGDCAYFCEARRRYDYVTGLGSPLTVTF